MSTEEMINRIYNDVGYLRGVVEPLTRLPERVTRLEERQEDTDVQVHFIRTRTEKVIAKVLLAVGALATTITAVSGVIVVFVH